MMAGGSPASSRYIWYSDVPGGVLSTHGSALVPLPLWLAMLPSSRSKLAGGSVGNLPVTVADRPRPGNGRRASLDPRFGGDPAGADRRHERGVIAFGLVGVGRGERRQRIVEDGPATEVSGDLGWIARARVGSGQGPGADLARTGACPARRSPAMSKPYFMSWSWRT